MVRQGIMVKNNFDAVLRFFLNVSFWFGSNERSKLQILTCRIKLMFANYTIFFPLIKK